jgi:hypothetical protein
VFSRRARLEYGLTRLLTLDPTFGSCSNFYREFIEAVFLGVTLNSYSTPPASGQATPRTRQEYRLKRYVSLYPTVGSCSNFNMSF